MGIKLETAADAGPVETEPVRIGIDIQGELQVNVAAHITATLRDDICRLLTSKFHGLQMTGWIADHGARPKDAD